MSSTAGDEGQDGWFGAKEVRNRGLPLAAMFIIYLLCQFIRVLTPKRQKPSKIELIFNIDNNNNNYNNNCNNKV